MRRYKKKKEIRGDFSIDDLPHNRVQVFTSLFRIRFLALLKILGLTALFLLPFLALNAYGRIEIRVLLDTLTEENSRTVFAQIYGSLFLRSLLNLPAFCLAFIGFYGLIRTLRKLAWAEITFLSDYFDNLKSSLLRLLFISSLSWLSYTIFLFAFYSIRALQLSPFLIGINLTLSTLQFSFVSAFSLFFLFQNDVYHIRFGHLLRNSLQFSFKSLLPCLGLFLLLYATFIFAVSGDVYWEILSDFLFLILLLPVSLTLVLYASFQCDKWINRRLFPNLFDKGIWRKGTLKKEEKKNP